MAGSIYGKNFTITTWGESHGKGVGVVIDGCPAGLELCEEDLQVMLDRRKPGQSKYATPRKESDKVEILSGVFEGKTTGTPISLMVRNEDQRSKDYSEIASYYRPGHADYTFDQKYGFRDYRGGGRSSARETIARVAAGAVAAKILKELGIEIIAFTIAIGPVIIDKENVNFDIINDNPMCMPDANAALKAEKFLDKCIEEKDSSGGVVGCFVRGLPAGIGEPVFDKLDANLAKAMFSIGAVKAFEIGNGYKSSLTKGSINNDSFIMKEGNVAKETNLSGGVLGGISDGDEVFMKIGIKPTPSIGATQKTVNKNGEEIEINISGRHDPVVVPRAVVVIEAMAALTVLDLMMENMNSKMDNLIKIYKD